MVLCHFLSTDLPQFRALFDYLPQQPDELCLMVGDVIRVFKKMADGVLLFQTIHLHSSTYIHIHTTIHIIHLVFYYMVENMLIDGTYTV